MLILNYLENPEEGLNDPPPPYLPVYLWENNLPVPGIKLLDWIFTNR